MCRFVSKLPSAQLRPDGTARRNAQIYCRRGQGGKGAGEPEGLKDANRAQWQAGDHRLSAGYLEELELRRGHGKANRKGCILFIAKE